MLVHRKMTSEKKMHIKISTGHHGELNGGKLLLLWREHYVGKAILLTRLDKI